MISEVKINQNQGSTVKQTKLWHDFEQVIENKKGILLSLGGRNILLWGALNPWHHQLDGHEFE